MRLDRTTINNILQAEQQIGGTIVHQDLYKLSKCHVRYVLYPAHTFTYNIINPKNTSTEFNYIYQLIY